MFTVYEVSDEFSRNSLLAKELLAGMLEELPPPSDSIRLPREHVLFSDRSERDKIFVLQGGFLRFERDEKLLFFLEGGELAGWGAHFHSEGVRLCSEFAFIVDQYDRGEFFKAIGSDPGLQTKWNEYVGLQTSMYTAIMSAMIPRDYRMSPETRHYNPGDPIIIQDTTPKEVFTLLHGQAAVFVGDVKVGEVLTGEIFGAMAASTNTRRSASVIAETECLTLTLPREHFLALTKTHPHTVEKLVEDMSRIIISQNEKLVQIEAGRS